MRVELKTTFDQKIERFSPSPPNKIPCAQKKKIGEFKGSVMNKVLPTFKHLILTKAIKPQPRSLKIRI